MRRSLELLREGRSCPSGREFRSIASLEIIPLLGVRVEPRAQLGAWSDILRPQVLANLRVRPAPGPQTIDEHPDAPTELARLVDLSELYFGHAEDVQPLEGELGEEVRALLDAVGVTGGTLEANLEAWAGEVNLETRLTPEGIDSRVLEELRRAGAYGRSTTQ